MLLVLETNIKCIQHRELQLQSVKLNLAVELQELSVSSKDLNLNFLDKKNKQKNPAN